MESSIALLFCSSISNRCVKVLLLERLAQSFVYLCNRSIESCKTRTKIQVNPVLPSVSATQLIKVVIMQVGLLDVWTKIRISYRAGEDSNDQLLVFLSSR